MELENITGSEAFGWWGVGGFFLVSGVLLHLATATFALTPMWLLTARVAAMLLDMLGIPFVLYGIATTLDKSRQDLYNSKPKRTSRDTILTILSFISASLPLLSAIWRALSGS